MKYLPKFRFSVRTLMIITALLCVGFGYLGLKMRRAQKQREVVAWVQEHRGFVNHSYNYNDEGVSNGFMSPVPLWLQNRGGEDFFFAVAGVYLSGGFNSDLTDISPLSQFKYLKVVDIQNTQVTDLTPLAHHSKIIKLNLAGTPVTDLSPLLGMNSLRYLDLYKSNVPKEEIARIQMVLPNCEINVRSHLLSRK
ncbi:MAG: hypothetical protein COA78_08765 [Blastopirellula sp.]|nr:MAG: hypothetical protein COA78_08765 [Blastopirellula sp.]